MSKDQLTQVLETGEVIHSQLRDACQNRLGVLDLNFLCKSLGQLHPQSPILVQEDAKIQEVVTLIKEDKNGCVLVVNPTEELVGIFTERDYIHRVHGVADAESRSVAEFMTPDPISQPIEATVAFGLNLMSHGGFRHLPVVDGENHPVGILSVKDVIDYIVNSYTEDLLNFEEE